MRQPYSTLRECTCSLQEGYVIGTGYEEIIVERLFDGKTQLNKALRPLINAAEQVLELDERKRQQTILCIDSGGGSVADINWVLSRGYQVHAKDYSGVRAKALTESVSEWITDPSDGSRQNRPGDCQRQSVLPSSQANSSTLSQE